MKKFFLCALLSALIILYPLLSLLAFPINADASEFTEPKTGDYACVLTNDAYFYTAPQTNSGLFLLPKTYYVRLLSYGSEYCKVEYQQEDMYTQKLTGYVKTERLAFVEYIPLRPYPYYVFDVTYRLDDLPQGTGNSFTEIVYTCAYYGDYPIGSETWCYVLRKGEFGYIPKPLDLSFEENTEYADYLASLKNEQSSDAIENEKTNGSSPAQIAILVALCLLVPLLAALILKPSRRPPYDPAE